MGDGDEIHIDLIRTEGLSKFYGSRRGIEGLDLRIHRGEIVGLLGPNGAGKTTTLRLLLGFLRPTVGKATINGMDCWRKRHEILKSVGYVPGHVRMYEQMRADRLIRLIGDLHGGDHLERAAYLAERLRLDTTLKIRKYSRGNKQKLAIVLAMMHSPALLVFDEPTISLDPIIADEVHHLLGEAREDGATVLFSSHVLTEVEKVCDRVDILREGRLIATESTEAFRHRHLQRLLVTFEGKPPTLSPEAGLRVVSRVNRHRIEYAVAGNVAAALRWLAAQRVASVEITWPRMEEVFLDYYRDTPASDATATGEGGGR